MSDLVELVRELFNISSTENEFKEALLLNNDSIDIVKDLLLNANTLGQKRKIETELGILQHYSNKIQKKLDIFKVGGSLLSTPSTSQQDKNIEWSEVCSKYPFFSVLSILFFFFYIGCNSL